MLVPTRLFKVWNFLKCWRYFLWTRGPLVTWSFSNSMEATFSLNILWHDLSSLSLLLISSPDWLLFIHWSILNKPLPRGLHTNHSFMMIPFPKCAHSSDTWSLFEYLLCKSCLNLHKNHTLFLLSLCTCFLHNIYNQKTSYVRVCLFPYQLFYLLVFCLHNQILVAFVFWYSKLLACMVAGILSQFNL